MMFNTIANCIISPVRADFEQRVDKLVNLSQATPDNVNIDVETLTEAFDLFK